MRSALSPFPGARPPPALTGDLPVDPDRIPRRVHPVRTQEDLRRMRRRAVGEQREGQTLAGRTELNAVKPTGGAGFPGDQVLITREVIVAFEPDLPDVVEPAVGRDQSRDLTAPAPHDPPDVPNVILMPEENPRPPGELVGLAAIGARPAVPKAAFLEP